MAEKRERRNKIYLGQILSEGRPIRCKVRHLTAESATVQTKDLLHIPVAFVLRLPSAKLDITCQVIWRDEGRVGVAFRSSQSIGLAG